MEILYFLFGLFVGGAFVSYLKKERIALLKDVAEMHKQDAEFWREKVK